MSIDKALERIVVALESIAATQKEILGVQKSMVANQGSVSKSEDSVPAPSDTPREVADVPVAEAPVAEVPVAEVPVAEVLTKEEVDKRLGAKYTALVSSGKTAAEARDMVFGVIREAPYSAQSLATVDPSQYAALIAAVEAL